MGRSNCRVLDKSHRSQSRMVGGCNLKTLEAVNWVGKEQTNSQLALKKRNWSLQSKTNRLPWSDSKSTNLTTQIMAKLSVKSLVCSCAMAMPMVENLEQCLCISLGVLCCWTPGDGFIRDIIALSAYPRRATTKQEHQIVSNSEPHSQ